MDAVDSSLMDDVNGSLIDADIDFIAEQNGKCKHKADPKKWQQNISKKEKILRTRIHIKEVGKWPMDICK